MKLCGTEAEAEAVAPSGFPVTCPRLSHLLELLSWGDLSQSLLLLVTSCKLLAAATAVAAAVTLFYEIPCIAAVKERALAMKAKVGTGTLRVLGCCNAAVDSVLLGQFIPKAVDVLLHHVLYSSTLLRFSFSRQWVREVACCCVHIDMPMEKGNKGCSGSVKALFPKPVSWRGCPLLLSRGFVAVQTEEANKEVTAMLEAQEVALQLRLIGQRIRSTLDRGVIVSTALLELRDMLGLENAALWLPAADGNAMELTNECEHRPSPVLTLIPLKDAAVSAVSGLPASPCLYCLCFPRVWLIHSCSPLWVTKLLGNWALCRADHAVIGAFEADLPLGRPLSAGACALLLPGGPVPGQIVSAKEAGLAAS